MKQFFALLLSTVIIVSGCSKSNSSRIISSPENEVKPTSAFRITNVLPNGMVREGQKILFENLSTSGVSYAWSFSNGATSAEKVPSNIEFGPCSMPFTASLTVKSSNGCESTVTQSFDVACSRGFGGRHSH
jgi:hypothetical protein